MKSIAQPKTYSIPRSCQFTHTPHVAHLHRLYFGTFLHLYKHSNFCCLSLLCWFCTVSPHFWIDSLDIYSVVFPGLLKAHIDNSHPFSWEFNDTEYFASMWDPSTFTALSSPEPVAVTLMCRMESSQLSPFAHKYKLHHYNQKNISMQHKVIYKLEKTKFTVICFL